MAPTSKTRAGVPVDLGIKVAIAGLSMPFRRPILSIARLMVAPLCPIDITASASPCRTKSTAFIYRCLFFFSVHQTALSLMLKTSFASTKVIFLKKALRG